MLKITDIEQGFAQKLMFANLVVVENVHSQESQFASHGNAKSLVPFRVNIVSVYHSGFALLFVHASFHEKDDIRITIACLVSP